MDKLQLQFSSEEKDIDVGKLKFVEQSIIVAMPK